MHFMPFCVLAITNEEDREFMQSLYVKYNRMMYRVAMRQLHDRGEAEDVVSSTCLALVKGIDKIKRVNPQLHKAYIMSIVRNEGKMLIRHRRMASRKVKEYQDMQLLREEANAQEMEGRLIYRRTAEEVKQAISQLPESDREILRMKVFDQLPDRVVAELLNVRVNTVRSRLRRARIRLRALMEVNGDAG